MCVCHLLLLTQQIQTTIFLCPCNMQDPSSPVRNWTHVPAGDMHSIYSHVWLFGLYSLWNSPSQNTGVGSLSLLQGIFPTQGLNPGLPHCRWILYQLSHQGSPRIQEWVAYPFSRGSSQPRNRTRISCIAGRSLPTELPGKHPPPPSRRSGEHWTTREFPRQIFKVQLIYNCFLFHMPSSELWHCKWLLTTS